MNKSILFFLILFYHTNTAMSQDSLVTKVWEDGIPKVIEYYEWKNGKRIKVKEIYFYTTGKKWEERTFTDTIGNSIFTRYDIEGKIEDSGQLNKSGMREGVYTQNYENGRKAIEGFYTDGKRQGTWKYWYESGQLQKQIVFKDDKLFSEDEWWKNGKKKLIHDSIGNMTRFFENGKMESQMTKSKKAFYITRWNEKGDKKEEGKFINWEYYLLNYWDEKNIQTVKNGNGFVLTVDGELGLPLRLIYKNGRISPK